jgi:hypothetical protein
VEGLEALWTWWEEGREQLVRPLLLSLKYYYHCLVG